MNVFAQVEQIKIEKHKGRPYPTCLISLRVLYPLRHQNYSEESKFKLKTYYGYENHERARHSFLVGCREIEKWEAEHIVRTNVFHIIVGPVVREGIDECHGEASTSFLGHAIGNRTNSPLLCFHQNVPLCESHNSKPSNKEGRRTNGHPFQKVIP